MAVPKKDLMTRRNRTGYVFIAPFLMGFALFILIPLFQSAWFSLSDIVIGQGGYRLNFLGTENYAYILLTDTAFREQILQSFQMTLRDILIVVPFSYFSAVLLSKSFRGRTAARAIFFLPVIVSTGVLATVGNSDIMNMMVNRDTAQAVTESGASESALAFVNQLFADTLPAQITAYVAAATDSLYDIIMKSGLQILIFLGGLNTIAPSIYESSDIEGATAWVNFWKITFPMTGPYLLLNVVYTIIDSFTSRSNPLIQRIWQNITGLKDFGIASAAAWLYFGMIGAVLAAVFILLSRRVYYRE